MKNIIKHLKKNYLSYIFQTFFVGFGILGALALDNWNQEIKQNSLEIQFLERLKTDLEIDIKYYTRRKNDSEIVVSSLRNYIQEVYNTQESIKDVKNLFLNIKWNSEHLTSQNITYIELVSTGQLNIIKNEILKRNLIEYYRENERKSVHIKEYNEHSADYLPHMGLKVNYGKFWDINSSIYNRPAMFLKDEWNWINDPTSEEFRAIETTVLVYSVKHRTFLKHFNELGKSAKNLFEILEMELNTRN